MTCNTKHTVRTELPYLARDALYTKEKPYSADFRVEHIPEAQFANHVLEKTSVTIRDVRQGPTPTLEHNGFCFLKAMTSLKAADATNKETSKMLQYLSDIQDILSENLHDYTRIEIMDFQVRKRHPGFPHQKGAKVEFEQPAAVPHSDFSVNGAFMRMEEVFPDQELHYAERSFDLLNVWRVLDGPNDDWPLALCDYQSVEKVHDTAANDCLHEASVGENWLLHANERHRWYYMSGQEEDDLIIFRNTDSEGILPYFQASPPSILLYVCNGCNTPDVPPPPNVTVVGRQSNFWLFSNRDGFDLTHPNDPSSAPVRPRIKLGTTTDPITIAPDKTAMIIIDMQNFFLSKAMGRERGEGHQAEEALLNHGIPAARTAGIQVLWLTWGITEEDLETLPPNIWRIFGFQPAADGEEFEIDEEVFSPAGEVNGMQQEIAGKFKSGTMKRKEKQADRGIGQELGYIKLDDGRTVSAGRLLMRDQWNTQLHAPLEASYLDGLKAKVPDVRFHKARLSGMWDASGEVQKFLKEHSIRTLLFNGVNSDQCVLATLQDACTQGWDTILLKDGCGTTSPDFARKTVLYNCERSWGFTSSCEDLAKSVRDMDFA